MKDIVAICPGSFDPVTNGHIDIIRRASSMFDKVIVLVAHNVEKNPMFTVDERVDMIQRATLELENVSVDSYGGLLAQYVKESGATAIVKGLRAVTDFEYEFQMALTNKKLCPEAETVFLTAKSEYTFLSSSIVKNVGKMNGDISDFVPGELLKDIKLRLMRKG